MKKTTSKLLEKAHKLVTGSVGTDVPKYKLEEAYRKVRAIYKRIKDIEPSIYEIINKDDNHKTTK
jgi:hypothetical protein